MDIRPGSAKYGETVSLKNTGIETSPYGVGGMMVGPDGKTLVVAVPEYKNDFGVAGGSDKRGNILVFNLTTLNTNTGAIDAPIIATLPSDGRSGKAPRTITATKDANRFLISNISDYNKGLSTLVLTRDADGKVKSAEMSVIDLSQPTNNIYIDRLDIQRAQSAVLVTVDGVEYAIVSDDNYHFLDPYWKAMYEAPSFLFTPSGPPIAVGGSASAKKVAVGGKLGIIKDPFGNAQFLGATLPLDGYGIINLGVSEDGKVLIGQLKGGYSGNLAIANNALPGESTPGWNTAFPSQSHAWNVADLIHAAVAMPDKDRMTKHINVKAYPNIEQLVKDNAGLVAGTFFDAGSVQVSTTGNMGDIIEVDLKRLVAHKLLKLPAPDTLNAAEKLLIKAREADIKSLMAELDNFTFVANEQQSIMSDTAQMQLLTKDKKAFNESSVVTSADQNFRNTGMMYFAPNITPDDLKTLRSGGTLSAGKNVSGIELSYTLKKDVNGITAGTSKITLSVSATDYTSNSMFFGDRPLDNPGYSAFTLTSDVKIGSTNWLDVYRVEQRLKYLGFPAMGASDAGGVPTREHNVIQDFTVDGKWTQSESLAANLFSDVITYSQGQRQLASPGGRALPNVAFGYTPANRTAYFNTLYATADSFTIRKGGGFTSNVWVSDAAAFTHYLNAYNAPHWMNLSVQMQKDGRLPTWENTQTGASSPLDDTQDKTFSAWKKRTESVEYYGTSWVSDLMAATQFTKGQLATGNQLRFFGGVDANQGITPFLHKTHDLGMAFDMGIVNLTKDSQTKSKEPLTLDAVSLAKTLFDPAHPEKGSRYDNLPDWDAYDNKRWSYANAIYLSEFLSADLGNNQQAALREFLSLYALTRQDAIGGNGTWEELPVKNGATVRSALFGSGQLAGDLISQVHIGGSAKNGQNPYLNINEILSVLGIKSSPVVAHQNHFHTYFNPPVDQPIAPSLLLADAAATQTNSSSTTLVDAQGLLDYTQTLITGEELMFTMDVPSVPAQQTQIVQTQAATTNAGKASRPDYILKDCTEVENPSNPMSATQSVNPANLLAITLENIGRITALGGDEFLAEVASIQIKLLEASTHGKLIPHTSKFGSTYYMYEADSGYLGDDKAVFMAEFQGKRYKIILDIHVMQFAGGNDNGSSCPPPKLIKVNGKPVSGSSGFDLGNITVTFADLAGGALGQTTGSTITLDTTAAGNNWFIDTTPSDNSEYLPTSNPNEWVAKAGSAAAGKMDMLSVLLHEYGHALGINHSADPNDFMGTTLTAGVRRLPTADEMALMQGLVAEAKASLSPSPSPANGGGEFPTLPLGTSFIGFLGLLRGSRYGGVSIAPDASTLVTQYDWAANTTLTNGSLNAADGWSTLGSVDIGPASTGSGQASTSSGRTGGGATLNEVSGSQTRLSQVFLLNPTDRFLSFTLSGTALDNLNGAPDDAFEVALLDANSGVSLLGSTGLTHSDAFLNLQGDGTEYAAAGVVRIDNADGSRTYRVDLSGIASATAVNLSFDLIGFGLNNSHVTVSDVRLSGLPQLHDEVASIAEDNLLTFDPYAQAAAQLRPLLSAQIVDAPLHGSVTVNAPSTGS